MTNLFYSEKEGICFYIPDYYIDCEKEVNVLIEKLQKEKQRFIELTDGYGIEQVKSEYIETSRHYKGMRVFYYKVNHVPDNAFVIEEKYEWTMYKWIYNR